MLAAHGKTKRQLGAFVMVTQDNTGLEQRLRDVAEKEKIQRIALGIGAPPAEYEIAKEADVTVVVYSPARRGLQKVTANFALRKGELDDAKTDAIVQAVAAVLPAEIHTVIPHAHEKEQTWRYTFATPSDGWFQSSFDDTSWKSGSGGFGTHGTPGGLIRTVWNTESIYLRREITLPEGSFANLHLRLHHDEDTAVYLNGVLAVRLTGYTTGYRDVPISEEARKTLRPGVNLLAVSCRQTGGGQYIDVGFIKLKR